MADPPQSVGAPAPQVQMRTFYLVFLRRGPNWTEAESPERAALAAAHMANIDRLIAEGRMVVAGPILEEEGDSAYTGLFILRAGSLREARLIVESDPAVQAGRFGYDILPWLAPDSLRF